MIFKYGLAHLQKIATSDPRQLSRDTRLEINAIRRQASGQRAYFWHRKRFYPVNYPMQPAMRIFIIDDEPPCRQAIRTFLQSGCPEATIIGEASSVADAVRVLPASMPDLLLLDVQLEDGTGFDLLDRFPKPGFRVIFTTAFDEFALRAFKVQRGGLFAETPGPGGPDRCRPSCYPAQRSCRLSAAVRATSP